MNGRCARSKTASEGSVVHWYARVLLVIRHASIVAGLCFASIMLIPSDASRVIAGPIVLLAAAGFAASMLLVVPLAINSRSESDRGYVGIHQSINTHSSNQIAGAHPTSWINERTMAGLVKLEVLLGALLVTGVIVSVVVGA